MSISKGKKRVSSLTDSIITAATAVTTVLTKDTYPRIMEPDTFLGDRKKFKTYEAQCRMYLWADRKKENWKNLKTVSEQVLFIISRLKSEAFDRLESYITQILKKGYIKNEEKVKKVFNNSDTYFNLLRQSFKNLDEARTAELRLLKFR
jgi:hypothetical protein